MAKATEVIYGYHPVLEALLAEKRTFQGVYAVTERISDRQKQILEITAQRKIPVKLLKASQLNTIAGTTSHQGICARVSPFVTVALDTLIREAKHSGQVPFLMLLDNILDPHNLGAVIRTAMCAGVHGVVIPKDRSAPPTPAVSRISAGALEHMPVARVTNLANTVKILKSEGIWVAGLDAASDLSVYGCDLTGPMAIVVGGEEKGVRPLVKKQCDYMISVPQKGRLDSLNASVAAAVVIYEAYRQRDFSRTAS